MLGNKQNVFDDFIAGSEKLIADGYTSPKKLAIEGGSNGGLLTAAVMLQRPDLFAAVVSAVPVTDMLRYHKLGVGRFWVPEYGTSDDPKQFAFLRAYSPLHNVKPDVSYPALLVTTAEGDDRVVPAHAFKFVATMQTVSNSPNPVLLRTETKAGHGGGKPISKVLDEEADVFAFLAKVLGIEW
jgi:prolyl oligopeptidase